MKENKTTEKNNTTFLWKNRTKWTNPYIDLKKRARRLKLPNQKWKRGHYKRLQLTLQKKFFFNLEENT